MIGTEDLAIKRGAARLAIIVSHRRGHCCEDEGLPPAKRAPLLPCWGGSLPSPPGSVVQPVATKQSAARNS
ncbi:hypothetical protein ZHAS_00008648 [Anopheles sinensis]|uniref:Uncharacterized protein n=1 Tax=Anopheles sinensis TaxID=74873 RepID=A0A084VST6_ANOSI|nr:hypothetical protein ZHAS_00008648 [Anopheles sinensis]